MARILLPITVDPVDLEAEAWEVLTEAFPGWTPSRAHIETILLQASAQMDADVLFTLSGVGDEILRYFGRSIARLPPVEALPATGLTTWTMVNDAGYPIPHGTTVVVATPSGEPAAFEVVGDQLVASGAVTKAGIPVEAIEPGEAANSSTGPVELDTPLDYVIGVTLDAATGGGSDREGDEDYLDRLTETLALQSVRLVLPDEFAVLARSHPGVHRATVLDNFYPGNDAVQSIVVSGATGGTFTLTFDGQTTGALAYNATAATVQAALVALSNVAAGDAVVSGGPLGAGAVSVTFTGAHGLRVVANMTTSSGLLTPAGTAVGVATTTAGVVPGGGYERMVTVAVVDEQGERVPAAVREALRAGLDARREVNFAVYVIDPVYTTVNVAVEVEVVAWPGWDAAVVSAEVAAAVREFMSPAAWGLPAAGDSEEWYNQLTVRPLDVANRVGDVESVRSIVSVTLNGGLAPVTLAGPVGLPRAGTVTVTIGG